MVNEEKKLGRFGGGIARRAPAIRPDQINIGVMHMLEGCSREFVSAVEFFGKFVMFLITEHLTRSQSSSQYPSSKHNVGTYHTLKSQQRALQIRLRDIHTSLENLHVGTKNVQERIRRLLAVTDSLINQQDSRISLSNAQANVSIAEQSRRIAEESRAIAAETRRDSTSMKTIASLTMVYLPSTFAATLFSTGFFSFPSSATDSLSVDPQIWILFVLAIVLSFLTSTIWIWLNKNGVPKQLDWVRQKPVEVTARSIPHVNDSFSTSGKAPTNEGSTNLGAGGAGNEEIQMQPITNARPSLQHTASSRAGSSVAPQVDAV